MINEDKNIYLEDLERKIKKLPTRIILEWCFKFSKFLFENALERKTEVGGVFWFDLKDSCGMIKKNCVCAWHINYLVYYAIIYSNDERSQKQKELKNLDFYYMLNRCSSLVDVEIPKIAKTQDEKIKFFEGFGEDQFKYQLIYNYFNDLNRLIYIFCKAKYDKFVTDKLEEIIKSKFNCNIYSFLIHMAYIMGAYTKNNNYNNFHTLEPAHYVHLKGIEYKVLEKVIRYYSKSYKDVRKERLKQLIFNSKPFIVNKKDEFLCVNIYSLYFVFGNCLYWIIRDEYKNISTDFISKFGDMFEKYFLDIFEQNGLKNYISKISEDNKHDMPDYEFVYKDYKIIFECKSHIPLINAIQQIPEIDSINKNLRHIEKAQKQIKSYIDLKKIEGKVLKVVVEFSHDYDCGLLRENLENAEENLIIINIVQIEAICLLYLKDSKKFDKFMEKLFDFQYLKSIYYEINTVFYEMKIDINNYYYEPEKNYIIEMVKEIEKINEK